MVTEGGGAATWRFVATADEVSEEMDEETAKEVAAGLAAAGFGDFSGLGCSENGCSGHSSSGHGNCSGLV